MLLFLGMGLLGMGNGAVFQLVPQRFPAGIGIVTGVVGAAGGLGGFFLPTLLGVVKDCDGRVRARLVGHRRCFLMASVVSARVGIAVVGPLAHDAVRRRGSLPTGRARGEPAGKPRERVLLAMPTRWITMER